MALLDPVDDNRALAVIMLGLYLAVGVVTRPLDPPSVPPLASEMVVVTAAFVALYAGVHLIAGSTYELWGTVTRAVVGLSLLAFLSFIGPGARFADVDFPPTWALAAVAAPVAVYISFRVGRLGYLVLAERRAENEVSY